MAQAAAGAVGPSDPREIVLLDGVNDERVAVGCGFGEREIRGITREERPAARRRRLRAREKDEG